MTSINGLLRRTSVFILFLEIRKIRRCTKERWKQCEADHKGKQAAQEGSDKCLACLRLRLSHEGVGRQQGNEAVSDGTTLVHWSRLAAATLDVRLDVHAARLSGQESTLRVRERAAKTRQHDLHSCIRSKWLRDELVIGWRAAELRRLQECGRNAQASERRQKKMRRR